MHIIFWSIFSDFVFENNESSDSEESEGEFDKKTFKCGYHYSEILVFLSKCHNCKMSYSTLLRYLKEYGLQSQKLIDPRFEDELVN